MKLSAFLKGIKKKQPSFMRGNNPVFVTEFNNPITDVKEALIGATITAVYDDGFTAKKGKYLYTVDVEQHEYTEDEEEDMTEDELCSFILSSVEVQR